MGKLCIQIVCFLLFACSSYGAIGDVADAVGDYDLSGSNAHPNGWTYADGSGNPWTSWGALYPIDFPLGENGWQVGSGHWFCLSKQVNNHAVFDAQIGDLIGHAPYQIIWEVDEAGWYKIETINFRIRDNDNLSCELIVAGTPYIIGTLGRTWNQLPGVNRTDPLTFVMYAYLDAGDLIALHVMGNDYCASYMRVEEISGPGTLLYVSPDGNDGNDGSEENPFATIGRAKEAVRTQIALGLTEDVTVYIRDGVYYLDETLAFTPLDSGTVDHNITYRTYPGESPVISGGRRLEGWSSLGDSKYSVTLPEVAADTWWFRQLWADGHRCRRSRWPNEIGALAITHNGPWSYGGDNTNLSADTASFNMNHVPVDNWMADLFPLGGADAWLRHGITIGVAKAQTAANGIDIQAGDVFGHGVTIIRWTAPDDLTIRVTGNVWRTRNSDWIDVWLLEDGDWGGNTAAQRHHIGDIPFSSYPRSAPLDFGAIEFDVEKFQNVQLVVAGNDFAGMNMTVEDVVGSDSWDLADDWTDTQDAISGDFKTIEFFDAPPGTNMVDNRTELVMLHAWTSGRTLLSGDPIGASVTTENVCGLIGHGGGALQPSLGNQLFLEHHPDFIDVATEWHLDSATGVLTYQSPSGLRPNISTIIAPKLHRLVVIAGTELDPVRNIIFKGLSFKHTKWDLPEMGYTGLQAGVHLTPGGGEDAYIVPLAVQLTYADNCRFERCYFANIAQTAIGFAEGVDDCEIIDCELSDIGGSGIMIGYRGGDDINGAIFGGTGNAITDWSVPGDAPVGNRIINNYIHGCGAEWFGCVGIADQFTVNTTMLKNNIDDLPYTGLSSGFNWTDVVTSQSGTVIAQNHIHDCMKLLNDGGGIYTLGNHQGGLIDGNLIYDIYRNVGLYNDQGSSNFTVADNIVYNCKETYFWHCNQCIENTFTWGTNYWDDDHGSPGQPQWIMDAAGVEPDAPVLNTFMFDCGSILVTGSCSPWAQINSAVIEESQQDVSGYLAVGDNGAIYGAIPKTSIDSATATVKVTVADPDGELSVAGYSNSIELFTSGDINTDCVVDVADVAALVNQWLNTDCGDPDWCSGADIDHSMTVGLSDYAEIAGHWQEK